MLKYYAVMENINLCKIPTILLELKACVKDNSDFTSNQRWWIFYCYRWFFEGHCIYINGGNTLKNIFYLGKYEIIKKFSWWGQSVLSQTFRVTETFNKLWNYYHFFVVLNTKVRIIKLPNKITVHLPKSSWIDLLQRKN